MASGASWTGDVGKINRTQRPQRAAGENGTLVKGPKLSQQDRQSGGWTVEECHDAFEVGADFPGDFHYRRHPWLHRRIGRFRGHRPVSVLYFRGDLPDPADPGSDNLSGVAACLGGPADEGTETAESIRVATRLH